GEVPTVWVAETVCGPGARSLVSISVKLPAPSTVASPAGSPSIDTWTIAPGAPRPTMGGRRSVVCDPSAGWSTMGGPVSQMRSLLQVAPCGQSPSTTQRTQAFAAVSQAGVGLAQSVDDLQPQMPVVVSQAGRVGSLQLTGLVPLQDPA